MQDKKLWGAWLGVAAVAALAIALVLVRLDGSLDAEMSVEQATAGTHTEKTVAVRRAARSAYVALLERWLQPASQRAERGRSIEASVTSVRRASREFAGLVPLSGAEDSARGRFLVAMTVWSDGMDQALVATDVPDSLNELREQLDAIDSTSDSVLEEASISGSHHEQRVAALRREHTLVQAAFGVLTVGILGLAFAWWRRSVNSDHARVEQEQAARLRAQFFANMSHELRTPLIAIRGFATTIEEHVRADGTLRAAARQIDSGAKDLLGVINNILDACKIDAGKMELQLENVALASVVDRPMQRCQGLVGTKLISLGIDIPADLPELHVDVVKLQQVMTNLLANAIKFTERGSVKLSARDTGAGRVAIDVTDTGVGIRPEALARIGKPFEQGDAGTSRHFGGSGLGLAIVHSIVELLGGEVRIESKLGVGTCVTVLLPVAQRETGQSRVSGASKNQGPHPVAH